ncbi:MAG: DUF1343 domain-containing protein [Saprospiraceae bacterium]|nr:DUF1343 domain-containing protein [Saprospiraceae bacterium]
MKVLLVSIILLFSFICSSSEEHKSNQETDIKPGAYQIESYIDQLKGKRIGMVVNHTSMIEETHVVDSLISLGIHVTKIFAPEHGYKGKADAGEYIADEKKDLASIISLYGKKKKPTEADLQDVDILVFDIQDVGVRFYTYISTLHYVMEAAAENDIPIIVLDRPNPNGFYVDGPVLKKEFSSFAGMHTVPVVYGLTIGEYAMMINGENWLSNEVEATLKIVKLENYNHNMVCQLPIKPSPNLPNLRSILLYPSLCYFEGTHASVGRGTSDQFQVIGHPALKENYDFSYIPRSGEGAKYPKHENKECFGLDLSQIATSQLIDAKRIDLDYLIQVHKDFIDKETPFFIDNNFFDKLAGSDTFKKQIIEGLTSDEIRETWTNDLIDYKRIRAKYLMYPDFE